MSQEADKSAYQRVIDLVTDGCGCACHTGIGYRSSCEHCIAYYEKLTGRYRMVTCYAKNKNPDHPPVPIYAYVEWEGVEPPIPGELIGKIVRQEAQGWVDPLETIRALTEEG